MPPNSDFNERFDHLFETLEDGTDEKMIMAGTVILIQTLSAEQLNDWAAVSRALRISVSR